MFFGNGHSDYYSGYNLDTFFSIVPLQQRIPKLFVKLDLLNAAIFWQTNRERLKHNLGQFQYHKKLEQMATLQSSQMREHNFFDHENKFDSRYRTLSDRLESVKDENFNGFMSYAENIADCPVIKANESFTYSFKNGIVHLYSMDGKEILPFTYSEMAKSAVDAWMNSSGHRANILNPTYQYLGCGCVPYEQKGNGYSITYFKLTQNLGGELVPPSIIETVKQTFRTVFNPHGTEKTNKSNASFGSLRQSKSKNTMETNPKLSLNVDIVFCIEVTNRMFGKLDFVKSHILEFYSLVMNDMKKHEKHVDKFRIKVIAFRDFESDKENALEILDFIEFPKRQTEFNLFIGSLKAKGGKTGYNNGLEALALAMDSNWNNDSDKKRHVIVVYSATPTHPLEKKSEYKPDGMPANFNELTDWWDNMNDPAKRLILFAPDVNSWNNISFGWDLVIHYPSTAGVGIPNEDFNTIAHEIVLSHSWY